MAKKFDSESCELIAPVTALEFVNTKLFVGKCSDIYELFYCMFKVEFECLHECSV